MAGNADVAVTKTATVARRFRRHGRHLFRAVTFTITVSNSGPGVATGVTLQDVLPARFKFLAASVSQGSFALADGTLTASLGTLQPGGIATITVFGRLFRAGAVSNTAVVPLAAYDPNAANNQATALIANGIPLFFNDPLDKLINLHILKRR